MANIKKTTTPEQDGVFIDQVNANYQKRKEAREQAAKARRAELERIHRVNRRVAVWGTVGSAAVLVAGFAAWFI